MFVRAWEGSNHRCRLLVFGWSNSDLVQLVKELPLTARGDSGENAQDRSEHTIYERNITANREKRVE